jgi:hypothetical protein
VCTLRWVTMLLRNSRLWIILLTGVFLFNLALFRLSDSGAGRRQSAGATGCALSTEQFQPMHLVVIFGIVGTIVILIWKAPRISRKALVN